MGTGGPSGGGDHHRPADPALFRRRQGAVLLGGRDVQHPHRGADGADLLSFRRCTCLRRASETTSAPPGRTPRRRRYYGRRSLPSAAIFWKRPGGLDAVIGAKGVHLSGGEMQRIAGKGDLKGRTHRGAG